MAADFLVIGGGIGGAVLAELLGRGGKKVVVLEKSLAPPHWARPELLWPGTMDVLFSLSPKELWKKKAVLPARGVEFHDGRQTIPFITAEVVVPVFCFPGDRALGGPSSVATASLSPFHLNDVPGEGGLTANGDEH